MTQKWKTNQTTSKIRKPYINGKPKRQETHQYPYLSPKVVVVAEKLDPTVGQLYFCLIFQTVRNLQKGTTGMSSEGPKMVEGIVSCSARVQRRFAVKFHGRDHLTLLLLPRWRVCKVGGRSRLPQLKLERPKNGSKRPSSVFTILGRFFSRVLEIKMSVLGVGFHLSCKARFI